MQYEVYVTDYLEPMDPHDLTLLTEKLTAIHGCLNQRPQHEKQKLLKDMFKRSLIKHHTISEQWKKWITYSTAIYSGSWFLCLQCHRKVISLETSPISATFAGIALALLNLFHIVHFKLVVYGQVISARCAKHIYPQHISRRCLHSYDCLSKVGRDTLAGS